MKIILTISSLGPGGAERILSLLANRLAGAGHQITVVTLADTGEPPFYSLVPDVEQVCLGARWRRRGVFRTNLRLVARLRENIRRRQPDVVIAFINRTNIRALAATRGLGIPVIVSERIDPARVPLGRMWERLRRLLYPRAAALVVQTEAAAQYFRPSCEAILHVIPNPVPRPNTESEADILLPSPAIVAMGRLVEQKGFDLLLHAFARPAQIHPEWTLLIFGEGPLRGHLEALRDELGLGERVRMPGRTRTVGAQLQRARIFVLSSRFEGFPNALCEAMACGCAVVTADCPSGPADIVRDGVDGLLVPAEDVDALADALERLIEDGDLRRRLGARAVEITDRFGEERILEQWKELIHNAAEGRP
jgi:glycosyltransferase involved in cell wall biosynthesis